MLWFNIDKAWLMILKPSTRKVPLIYLFASEYLNRGFFSPSELRAQILVSTWFVKIKVSHTMSMVIACVRWILQNLISLPMRSSLSCMKFFSRIYLALTINIFETKPSVAFKEHRQWHARDYNNAIMAHFYDFGPNIHETNLPYTDVRIHNDKNFISRSIILQTSIQPPSVQNSIPFDNFKSLNELKYWYILAPMVCQAVWTAE